MSKKSKLTRLFATFMATATAVGCSSTTPAKTDNITNNVNITDNITTTITETPTAEPITQPVEDTAWCHLNSDGIYVDNDGNVIDLGGMEITVRDWWSSGKRKDSPSEYEQAQYDYWDEIQKTYNFKINKISLDDWDTIPYDYVEYASAPDDGNNYVYTLKTDPAVTTAINQGLMYDLSSLGVFDFTEPKFASNGLYEQFTRDGKVYAMSTGSPEPRTGVFFNKQILSEGGIEPDYIYDLQKADEWTWEKFEEILSKVQRDTDGDGIEDMFGISCREDIMTTAAIFSNRGKIIGWDKSNGEFTYNLEDENTINALEWVVDIYKEYDSHDPEGAEWDYYKSEFTEGHSAFMVDDEYCGMPQGFLDTIMLNDKIGFVMFPKGPEGMLINVWNDNLMVIPSNYSLDKARKIAFAYNLYTEPVPGYELYNERVADAEANGVFDERAKTETIPMMVANNHGTVAYHGLVPSLDVGPDLLYWIDGKTVVSDAIESVRDTWLGYIDAANSQ